MRALQFTAFAAAAVAYGYAQDAALAVVGHGVHHGRRTTKARLNDVATTATRLLGLEVPVANDDISLGLPVGDLLQRPRACLIVAIDGIGKEMVSQNVQEMPFIGHVFSQGNDFELEPFSFTGGHKVKESLSFENSDLSTILHDQFPASAFVAASGDEQMVQASRAKVKVIEVTETLEQELALLSSVRDKLSLEIINDDSPDILVLGVSSLRDSASTMALSKLDEAVSQLFNELTELYEGRMVAEIVLLGKSLVPYNSSSGKRGLAETSTVSATFVAGLEAEAFLLHVWVSVVFIFILILVFLCVPWAEELDPILYAGLGRDDLKKD